jgi:hypothetical protein
MFGLSAVALGQAVSPTASKSQSKYSVEAFDMNSSEMSNQQAGSLLFYNLYSSNGTAPNTQNTRVSITNINPNLPIAVHLFFVDGAACSIADSLLYLTANQTASFLASDIDPGTSGYIIAVVSDLLTGCPVNFNYLIGDE